MKLTRAWKGLAATVSKAKKPNQLREELAGYLQSKTEGSLGPTDRDQPVPGKAWKVLLVKPRNPE